MRTSIIFPAIAGALLLAGCSQAVPKCGDTKTVNLVKEIADREMAKQLGTDAAKFFSYEVEAIRTTDTNAQTGAYTCAAELKVKGKNGAASSLAITYTVEKTDDGKQFYVQVFGL